MQKKQSKKRGTWGAYARNFPRSVAWKVDQDYVEKLSDEERLFLARFNDHFYGADFRTDYDVEWPTVERRKAYINKNVANQDVFSLAQSGELLEDVFDCVDLEAMDPDLAPEPALPQLRGVQGRARRLP